MDRFANPVETLSKRTYFSRAALGRYVTYDLTRTEAIVLLKYQPFFAGKEILDIGVGTGRTTIYLEPLAKRYVGIDFSPTFIDYMNVTMPQIQARLCDMRDLTGVASANSFDFVMGSFNVIDEVVHKDRVKILCEIYRILRPGGIFLFSSHNHTYELAGRGPRLHLSRNPIWQVRFAFQWFHQLINHAGVKKYRLFKNDYAILNDEGHDFSTLQYYINQNAQRRQLEESDFNVLEVYDVAGNPLAPEIIDTRSPFLTYVAQKPLCVRNESE